MDSWLTLLQTGEKEGGHFWNLGSRNDCNATGAMAAAFGTIPMSRHLFRWNLPLPAVPADEQCSANPLGPPEQQKVRLRIFLSFVVIEKKIK
jgi:hypothetical protein